MDDGQGGAVEDGYGQLLALDVLLHQQLLAVLARAAYGCGQLRRIVHDLHAHRGPLAGRLDHAGHGDARHLITRDDLARGGGNTRRYHGLFGEHLVKAVAAGGRAGSRVGQPQLLQVGLQTAVLAEGAVDDVEAKLRPLRDGRRLVVHHNGCHPGEPLGAQGLQHRLPGDQRYLALRARPAHQQGDLRVFRQCLHGM